MNIVVTGATGAIGMALIEKFLDKGDNVVAFCHEGSKRIKNLPKDKNLKIIEYDLNAGDEGLYELKPNYDVFYHMAWEGTTGNQRNDFDVQMRNVKNTLNSVELAKKLGCKRYVGIGSQAEYGRVNDVIDEKTLTVPENVYGAAKLSACNYSRIMCEQADMEHVWVRVFSVYGPGDGDRSFVMSLINTLKKGEVFKCTKCEQIWDYLYSKDAANALYLLATKGKPDNIYCLSNGKSMELKEYAEIVKKAIVDLYGIDLCGRIDYGAIPYGVNQVMNLKNNISKLCLDTGFQPMYSFEKGVLETIEWMNR